MCEEQTSSQIPQGGYIVKTNDSLTVQWTNARYLSSELNPGCGLFYRMERLNLQLGYRCWNCILSVEPPGKWNSRDSNKILIAVSCSDCSPIPDISSRSL